MLAQIVKNTTIFLIAFTSIAGVSYAGTPETLSDARGNESICQLDVTEQIRPKLSKTGTYDVNIGITPLALKEISPTNNTAEIDFYFTIEYDINENLPNVKCVGSKAFKVWDIFYNPDIEFLSISDPQYLQGFHWMIQHKKFAYMTRVRGRVQLHGNFKFFPFDNLSIKITVSPEDAASYVSLKPSAWYHENLSNLKSDFEYINTPGWKLKNAYFLHKFDISNTQNKPTYWDELSLVLDIERYPTTLFVRTSVPPLILFLISFFSLLLKNEKNLPSGVDRFVEARISIQSGTLLALFAFTLFIMQTIPETSYLTLGDINWFIFMFSTSLIIFSEYLPNIANIGRTKVHIKLFLLIIASSLVSLLMIYQFFLLIQT